MGILDKLKLLLVLRSTYSKVKEAVVKSGWKTSEFWLAIFTIVVNLWFSINGMLPAETVTWIISIVVLAYTVARAVVKFTPTLKDDELLAKFEAIVAARKGV